MSMQIVYAKVEGKELKFDYDNGFVNLTEGLRLTKLVEKYFVDNSFMEGDEEIFYKTMSFDKTGKLLADIEKFEQGVWEEVKAAMGAILKNEKMMLFRDFSLLKNIIIKMILQDCNDDEKFLALV